MPKESKTSMTCPGCGSGSTKKKGFELYSRARRVQVYQCKSCGKRFQENYLITESINCTFESFIKKDEFHVKPPCIVTGDRHLPFMSLEWHKKLMEVAKHRGIKTLIESGDYFNQDVFSHWFQPYQPYVGLDWSKELKSATEIMDDLLSWFDKIYIITGNHDLRIWRAVGRGQDMNTIFRLVTADPRVKVSNLPYCYAGDDDEFMIVHPKSYSQITTATPKKLSEKFHKHIIGAHGHFFGLDYDKSGKFLAVASGGLFNYDSLLYVHASITTHDAWKNGFCVINDKGKVRLYGDVLE